MFCVSPTVRKHRSTPVDISLYIPSRSQEPELWNPAHIRAAGGGWVGILPLADPCSFLPESGILSRMRLGPFLSWKEAS